ncbi:hypothetical protein H0A43_08230 [Arcobacter lanthieri]|uniref:hypothetical protein n=1 Tax=Aliarcobacter lanthieri TaxID=1355374 RepID=UPI001921F1F6|nr:hypothetical protein [Aliarcobacter lanthieri]MBL3520462.1 hypothetical protein [Aliarcobacter lanthieri]
MIIVLLNNIGIFLFVYTLLNHINYKYDTSQAVSYNLKISKIFQVGKVKLKTYHIIVDKYKDEKNKNFIVPYKIYKSLNKFDNITIEVKNGYFGFEYIDIIIKDNKRIDTLLNK